MSSIAALIIVAGCSFKEKIADNALDFNQSIETANNKLILLNIIRGSFRSPMYFSRLGQITGLLTSEVDVAAEAAINRGSGAFPDASLGLASRGTLASRPNFVIQNLESQEFYNGILKPLSVETFEYYWNQGWPEELLIHLFVERLDLIFPGGEACYLESDPTDQESFVLFSGYVTRFMDQQPVLRPEPNPASFGPPIPVATAGTGAIQGLVEASEAGFDVDGAGDQIQLQKTSKKYKFIYPDGRSSEIVDKEVGYSAECRMEQEFDEMLERRFREIQFEVQARAAQGIIYYLGEVVRAQIDPEVGEERYVPEVTIKGKTQPLFRVVEGPGNFAVSVSYRGKRFGIPDAEDEAGRSMQVMALLHQVFSQSTSAKDLPTADTIRIAN